MRMVATFYTLYVNVRKTIVFGEVRCYMRSPEINTKHTISQVISMYTFILGTWMQYTHNANPIVDGIKVISGHWKGNCKNG